ncbi:hypothetical protein AFLA_008919 [Aspergillus flavus NRRL3357]|nr:hypothetical protein AFLA_008919 [Aspergillus flavus NRRL3357]
MMPDQEGLNRLQRDLLVHPEAYSASRQYIIDGPSPWQLGPWSRLHLILHTQVTDRVCLNICISNGDQQSLKPVTTVPRRRNYAHFPADSPVHETRNVWGFFSY